MKAASPSKTTAAAKELTPSPARKQRSATSSSEPLKSPAPTPPPCLRFPSIRTCPRDRLLRKSAILSYLACLRAWAKHPNLSLLLWDRHLACHNLSLLLWDRHLACHRYGAGKMPTPQERNSMQTGEISSPRVCGRIESMRW